MKARRIAVLSTTSGQMARSLDPGCGWPISYCPVQAVYQWPGQAKADGRFIKADAFYQGLVKDGRFVSQWPLTVLSPMADLSRRKESFAGPNGRCIKGNCCFSNGSPNGRFITDGRFIKAQRRLASRNARQAPMAVLSPMADLSRRS